MLLGKRDKVKINSHSSELLKPDIQFPPSNTVSGITWKHKQTKPNQKNNQTRNSRKEEAQGEKAEQGRFDGHRAV